VRDLVKYFKHPDDIGEHIASFALDVTERMQEQDPLPISKGNFLANLTVGDPMAENELQTLSRYYLRTDQFGRASRGEVNLVVGRKGAGKTALFSQLRDDKRRDKANIVVDLKPEGYQLLKLKDDVLDFLSEGAKSHLITAFWEYILLLEVCYKVLEKDRDRYTRDGQLYEPYRELEAAYKAGDAGEGDFSERLLALSQTLVQDYTAKYGKAEGVRLTTGEVTELIYKHDLKVLKKALSSYLEFKKSIWVLFDNLDKGWSSHGIGGGDIMILRCLIDAARKIQRDMQRDEHDFHCVVFVRNDVYQLLVEESADYGKESRAVLDWSDGDLLREMLRRRLVQNLPQEAKETTFERVWSEVVISHHLGEDTSQFFIDRSLMRPRNLLKIFAHCRGSAVNFGREKIDDTDIEKGLKAYSLDLVTEADQELTDIEAAAEGLIYQFIGEGSEFSPDNLESLMSSHGLKSDAVSSVIEFMLYYGFLGIKIADGDAKYIYDVGYDLKILKVLMGKKAETFLYTFNPAFLPGLNT
jgi:hypothetical protein